MNVRIGLQPGFSLVELMVAVTVSLLLLSGVVQLFAGSKRAYQIQNDFGVLQENGRYATGILAGGIRVVDHWGGVGAGAITIGGGVAITATGNCNQAWATNVNTAIQGYEGASAIGSVSGFPSGCLATTDYVANSDIIVLRYADPNGATNTSPVDSSNPNEVYVSSLVGARAEISMGSNNVPGDLQGQNGLYNYPFVVEMYFLRPCSTKLLGTCQDTIPTLTRLKLGPGPGSSAVFIEETLVENIEQMQFQYGSDTDANGSADRYDNAGSVPNWGQVISVRVSLVAGGATRDNGYTDTSSYTLLDFNYIPATADRNRSRQVYTRFIQIRNRTRS